MGTRKQAGKPKKKKKLESNRFGDTVKDYARTNATVTDVNKEKINAQGGENWKAPLNNGEKFMIGVIIIGIIGCIIKYVIL